MIDVRDVLFGKGGRAINQRARIAVTKRLTLGRNMICALAGMMLPVS